LGHVSYQFNLAANRHTPHDTYEVLQRVLPVNARAEQSFYDVLNMEEACLVDALENDRPSYAHPRNDRVRKRLERKLASVIFMRFTPDDYRKLSLGQQKILIGHYIKLQESAPKKDMKFLRNVHNKLVRSVHMPPELMDMHQQKMKTLRKWILENDHLAAIYDDMLGANIHALDAQTRMAYARVHCEVLTRLYGMQFPEVKTYEMPSGDPQTSERASLMYHSLFLNHFEHRVKLSICLNVHPDMNRVYANDNTRFVRSLSHEFAHAVESTLGLAHPDYSMKYYTPETVDFYPVIDRNHPLADAQMIFLQNTDFKKEEPDAANFIALDAAESVAVYREQVRERHADWFGQLCYDTILDALRERKKFPANDNPDAEQTQKKLAKQLPRFPSFLV